MTLWILSGCYIFRDRCYGRLWGPDQELLMNKTSGLCFCVFWSFWAIFGCGDLRERSEGCWGCGGLTLAIAHLVQPPGFVFEHCWWKDNALSSLLIMIVDACHMWDVSDDVSIFGWLVKLCWFEGECWNMERPWDKHDTRVRACCHQCSSRLLFSFLACHLPVMDSYYVIGW
jgi:hypothetical protein